MPLMRGVMLQSTAMSHTKTLAIWFVVATVTLVAGWFLALHGGVYYESAQRAGEPGTIHLIEIVIAQILMWPEFGIGWLWRLLSPNKQPISIDVTVVIALHYAGYGAVFYAYRKYKNGKSISKNKTTENESAT